MGSATIIITPYAGNYRIAYYIVSEDRIDILRLHHTSRPIEFE